MGIPEYDLEAMKKKIIKDSENALKLFNEDLEYKRKTGWYKENDIMDLKLAIIGSRFFNDYETFKDEVGKTLLKLKYSYDLNEIVSGGALGTDSMAKKLADELDINYVEFPADWEKHGRKAGPIRNKEIAAYSSICIAFPIGESKGTRGCIKEFEKLKKEVYVVDVTK